MASFEGFEEKKWFVYLSDHHEGPFSAVELGQRMGMGLVNAASYVWAEGMPDWHPMSEVPELAPLYDPNAAATAAIPSIAPQEPGVVVARGGATRRIDSVTPEPADLELEPQPEPEPMAQPDPVAAQPATVQLSDAPPEAAEGSEYPEDEVPVEVEGSRSPSGFEHGDTSFAPAPEKPRSMIPYRLIAFLLIVGGIALGYTQGWFSQLAASPAVSAALKSGHGMLEPQLLKLAEKFPALGKWISPIPAIEDVAPGDYEALQAAARAKIAEVGPTLAVALSRADLTAPSFYVASNLPDGSRIDIYVEGVSDTLLNQLSFGGKVAAVVNRRLGKSETLRSADGKPIARGQYNVYAVEAPESEQPATTRIALGSLQPSKVALPDWMPKGLRLVATQSYFLGGAKDAVYTARLKEYHDRLRDKATNELNELRQFSSTLDMQLQKTLADFAQYAKLRNPKQRLAGWTAASNQWSTLQAQLDAGAAKLTPEALKNEYFYGSIYALLQSATQAIDRLHAAQGTYFTDPKIDLKAFEISQGQLTAAANEAATLLRTKVDAAVRLTPTPNGMPRKEGL